MYQLTLQMLLLLAVSLPSMRSQGNESYFSPLQGVIENRNITNSQKLKLKSQSSKIETRLLLPKAKGMPKNFTILSVKNEEGNQSFKIKRIAGNGQARFAVLMVDKDWNQIQLISMVSKDVNRPTSLSPGAESAAKIAKILVIVESFGDASGKWIIDTPDGKAPIEYILKNKGNVSLKAKSQ